MKTVTPSNARPESSPPGSPIAQLDIFLLAIRWAVILALGLMANLQGFTSNTVMLSMAIWLGVVAYNIPLSVYLVRRRPLMNRQMKWLLLVDLLQASVAVLLTGGYASFYFLLFVLVMAQLALVAHWKRAVMVMLGVAILQISVMVWGEFPTGDAYATYLIAGKFILSLLVGSLAILLGEMLRREDRARLAAARRAAWESTLNQALLRIHERDRDKDAIVTAILEGMREAPSIEQSCLLTPNADGAGWRLAASSPSDKATTPLSPDDWRPPQTDQPVFEAGAGAAHPLPDHMRAAGMQRMIGFFLREADGTPLGLLAGGWSQPCELSEDERAFLEGLAQEASLALRNARLHAQEQAHMDRLRQFDQRQSVFFSAIGHELKTPIAVLKMLAPSLEQCEQLPVDVKAEVVHTFDQNLARLETLVSDWLESARLEAGAVALHRQAVDLGKVARMLAANLKPVCERRGIRIVVEIEEDLPVIWADRRRVDQALSNLLNNAVKFSPADNVIRIAMVRREESVQVCVEDRGPGVPAEVRDHIFDKFYIATANQALAGSGLGLFIARELVELHGGRIWLESPAQDGSRFCFTLPIHASEVSHAES